MRGKRNGCPPRGAAPPEPAPVAAVTSLELEVHAFVEWLEVWKGELPAGALARVVTGLDSAACGYPFQENKELVIFAHSDSGELQTNTCTFTGRMTRAEALEAFGSPLAANTLDVEFRRGDVNADGDGRLTAC